MRSRRIRLVPFPVLIALLAVALALLATTGRASAQSESTLTLDIDGLPRLGQGYAYEGWLIVDGAPVSSGIFTVDDQGALSQSSFAVLVASAAASAFVLTIEPSPDPDPAPSNVHLLAGDLRGGVASLRIGHAEALGTDFAGASGSYVLAAPSADEAPYVNGIWWVDASAGPGPSLDLPELPEGWLYEGWVVGDDGPVTTGRFSTVSGADSDGGGPAAGTNMTPPFPGQDFVDPPTDLVGYMAVITVEPQPDDSPEPFVLHALVDEIEDVGAGTLQPMMLDPDSFPTGTAMVAAGGGAPSGGASPAPQTMPVTGGEHQTNTLLPLLAILIGLLLVGGRLAVQRRA